MVASLKEHKFIDHVYFYTFKPLADQTLDEIESQLGYPLDKFVTAFFKQSNGLHLAWHSKLGYLNIYDSQEKDATSPGTWYAGFDETEKCEGYAAIMPLDGIINTKLRLSDNINDHYKREGDIKGAKLHYLDKYSAFYDVCIYLNGRSEIDISKKTLDVVLYKKDLQK